MKLVILTNYFRPDLSAGSFRTTALVKELDARLPANQEIEVITTLPNRYASFTVEVPAFEQHGRLTIRRIALPAHQSGMKDQSRAFVTYAREVLRILSGMKIEYLYATSSRLMTAVLAAGIARRRRIPLYLDIRDIFVETISDVVRGPLIKLLRPGLELAERFAITSALHVNLVSQGFADYFERRYPRQSFSYITNGIDDEFVELNASLARTAGATASPAKPLTIVYAGNIGASQGLETIVPPLARALQGRARLRIIGDGGRRAALQDATRDLGNVSIEPPVKRDLLLEAYRSADVLFVHLNEYDAFTRVLPSKLFEYGASGKPIWAGVGGYSARFLTDHVENVAVFPPCDAQAGLAAFDRLDMQWRPRRSFVERFARAATTRALADDIMSRFRITP